MNKKTQPRHKGKGSRQNGDEPPKLQYFNRALDGFTAKELVKKADNNAEVFHNERIKANQIRNFYGAVEKIKMKYARNRTTERTLDQMAEAVKQDLWLLLPQLAYAKGRNNSTKMFCESMKNAVQRVLESAEGYQHKALENFFIYVESVVAYHKFYGDK